MTLTAATLTLPLVWTVTRIAFVRQDRLDVTIEIHRFGGMHCTDGGEDTKQGEMETHDDTWHGGIKMRVCGIQQAGMRLAVTPSGLERGDTDSSVTGH